MCREDAVKLALFVGGFTGSYHLLRGGLQQWMNQSHTQACFTAGCLAGESRGSLSGLTWLPSFWTQRASAGHLLLGQLMEAAREQYTDRATLTMLAGFLCTPPLSAASRHRMPML